jgi:peptide-methionine (S)-S-oxide reductase
MQKGTETAVFGGGCFWCTEAIFSDLKGVLKVTSGYAGGRTNNPSYLQVCSGSTGHAEVIKVDFDPSIVSYGDLLNVFFHVHDPTTPNRQGPDAGEQYRSVILYANPEQKRLAEQYIDSLKSIGEFSSPIVTQLRPLSEFYPAEEYHQRYFESNEAQPYCQMVIAPKFSKFKEKFKSLLKTP